MALLMVMGILVIFVLLALAFASSQITESKASLNFYYAAVAEQLARGGFDHAIALLKEDQTAAGTPGYDSYYDRWGYLNSTGQDGFNGSDVDLHGVFGSSGNKDAQWIQVTDPSSGSIIGRYAVFVEDEAGKLNINIAGNVLNTRDGSVADPSNE